MKKLKIIRKNFIIRKDDFAIIKQAAEIYGSSVSEFIRQASLAESKNLIEKHQAKKKLGAVIHSQEVSI
jgi:uncharacterized protein (DUF1778 family)